MWEMYQKLIYALNNFDNLASEIYNLGLSNANLSKLSV